MLNLTDHNYLNLKTDLLIPIEHSCKRSLLILYFAFVHSTIQDTLVPRNTRDIMTSPRAVGTRRPRTTATCRVSFYGVSVGAEKPMTSGLS